MSTKIYLAFTFASSRAFSIITLNSGFSSKDQALKRYGVRWLKIKLLSQYGTGIYDNIDTSQVVSANIVGAVAEATIFDMPQIMTFTWNKNHLLDCFLVSSAVDSPLRCEAQTKK